MPRWRLSMLGLARALQHTTPRRLRTTLRAEAAYAELVLKTNRDADVSAESLSELLMECAGALSVSASDANAGTADEEAIFGEPPTDLDVFLDEDRWRSEAYWQSAEVRALFASQNDAQAALRFVENTLGAEAVAGSKIDDLAKDVDWLAVQEAARPVVTVGELEILLPWHETSSDPELAMRQLRVEGGAAFGTGEHQTTRMCCEWLQETTFPAFYTMCDYGCGSGILALTALRFGAACAVGIDIDPDCVKAAERNRASNGFGANEARFYLPPLDAGGDASSIAYVNKRFTSAPEGVAPFPGDELPCDVVVANILLRPLLALRDTILARVRPGGALAMSGVRVDQVDDVLGAYASSFETAAVDREVDGWVLIECRGKL
mmetsp:Transcript_26239/g.68179  ORF Transcript_26239/g.68179 Transcript_26239/m.68179 type:complete len:378 (-) Transcript_26239:26-1159(-)